MEGESRRRVTDRSGAEARLAVAGVVAQFGGWRADLARFAARAGRGPNAAERQAMLERCDAIAAELLEVRTALLLDLADAPQEVAGHSRVADVEKALDGVEAQTKELRRRLAAQDGRGPSAPRGRSSLGSRAGQATAQSSQR